MYVAHYICGGSKDPPYMVQVLGRLFRGAELECWLYWMVSRIFSDHAHSV